MCLHARLSVLRLMKLFDSSLDVEAASKILDENFAAQNAASDQQRNQQLGERDQRKQDQLAQIEQERQAAQDEIGQMAANSHAARQQQNQDDLQASEEALRQARQEWEAAIADAATQRQQADANAPDRLRRAQQDLEGMDDLLSQIGQDKVSVKGTFNALEPAASAQKARRNGLPRPPKRRRRTPRRSCRKPSMVGWCLTESGDWSRESGARRRQHCCSPKGIHNIAQGRDAGAHPG